MTGSRVVVDPSHVLPVAPRADFVLRVQSALVLVTIALVATYASLETFAWLIAATLAVMGWEWARLVRNRNLDPSFLLQLGATLLAAALMVGGQGPLAVCAVLTGAIAVLLLEALREGSRAAVWSAAGVAYAGLPAVALVWLRSDAEFGWHAIVFLFAVVWTTDSAAYLFGRALGGPRLAPAISPGKRWTGAIAGLAAAAMAGALYAGIVPGAHPLALAVLGAALSAVAQGGDLIESAVKRRFGRKDASGIIPGHGGVLDRVDGLLPAALVAAVAALALNPAAPGRGLLLW